jgi:hypothetical protein
MAAYLKTLLAGGAGIVSDATLREMEQPQTHLPIDVAPFRAGLGWYVGDAPNAWMTRALYWDGDTPNYHTFLRWLPDLGLGVFVSVNTASPVDVRGEVGLRALGLMVTAKTGRTPPAPPRPARVVHASARRLARAAGTWASGIGLDVIRASHGALRWTPAAQKPGATAYTKLPRADGWYAARRPQPGDLIDEAWIRPTTVGGRRVLLIRFVGSSPPQGTSGYAEKVPSSYRIPAAWQARAGAYKATNLLPRPYPGAVTTGLLTDNHGVLVWSKPDGTAKVLVPDGPNRAFTYGLSALGVERGSGDLASASGDRVTLLGTTYRRVGGG